MILMQGHAVTLAFQGSNPNVARDTLSQYGDHSCEIVYLLLLSIYLLFIYSFKFYFKSQSYVPETFLQNGHIVTLTFKVATQILYAARRLNMVIIYMK